MSQTNIHVTVNTDEFQASLIKTFLNGSCLLTRLINHFLIVDKLLN